jgi:aerobic carbon-monoxide dehydrogenase medium subunit
MHPAPFDYVAPAGLDEAVTILAEDAGAKPLAGGQSLLQAAALREVRPTLLVDIGGLGELRGVEEAGGVLRIGAGEPMARVARDSLVQRGAPLLVETLATVGAAAIRNRATLGGSAAWADPTSQLPAALLALDATYVVHGPDGTRPVPAAELATGVHTTTLAPGELITGVELPLRRFDGHALRLVRRTAITWPVAGCAATRDGKEVRLALFGAGPTVVLVGGVDEVAEAVAPLDDERGTSTYRRRVLPELAQRARNDLERGAP